MQVDAAGVFQYPMHIKETLRHVTHIRKHFTLRYELLEPAITFDAGFATAFLMSLTRWADLGSQSHISSNALICGSMFRKPAPLKMV